MELISEAATSGRFMPHLATEECDGAPRGTEAIDEYATATEEAQQ